MANIQTTSNLMTWRQLRWVVANTKKCLERGYWEPGEKEDAIEDLDYIVKQLAQKTGWVL